MSKYWIVLLIAGLFEAVWVVSMKYSEGFTKLYPSIVTIVAMIVSMYLLSYSVKSLPVGTAYAVWTGIGILVSVVAGMFLFNESKELIRLFFIFLIFAGIVGLKIVTN